MKEKNLIPDSFKCPSCGSDMRPDPASGIPRCVSCGCEEALCAQSRETEEYDFAGAELSAPMNDWGFQAKTMKCPRCGGKIVWPAEITPGPCVFCGCPDIAPSEELPGVKPDLIIPFKLDAVQAGAMVAEWIKKLKLAPFSMKKDCHAGMLRGVYIPYWSFDASVKTAYTGQAGNRYTDTDMNTRTVDGKTETSSKKVQKIRWRFVSGSYNKSFAGVMFNDSGRFEPDVIGKIEPFKLNELVKYDLKYLQGFTVEHCKSGLKAVWDRAKAYMNGVIQKDIHDIIKRGGDVVGKVNIDAAYSGIAVKHMLLPVFLSSFQYKKKTYDIYVNGQTGEVRGRSPKSALKIGIIALIVLGALTAAYFLLIHK